MPRCMEVICRNEVVELAKAGDKIIITGLSLLSLCILYLCILYLHIQNAYMFCKLPPCILYLQTHHAYLFIIIVLFYTILTYPKLIK